MKKLMLFRIIGIIASVVFIVSIISLPVCAKEAKRVNEKVDVNAQCSMTFTYKSNDIPFRFCGVNIYHIATIDENGTYTMAGDFNQMAVEPNNIKTEEEWEALSSTVSMYMMANDFKPTGTRYTDNSGTVSFTGLDVGLYLVSFVPRYGAPEDVFTKPFIYSVPNLDANGRLIYDIEALPKANGEYNPSSSSSSVSSTSSKENEHTGADYDYEEDSEPTVKDADVDVNDVPSNYYEWNGYDFNEYAIDNRDGAYKEIKAVKQWKDYSAATRSGSIRIAVIENGKKVKSLSLNSANNWTQKWKAKKGKIYGVIETDVPDGYTVSIKSNKNVFYVTNTIRSSSTAVNNLYSPKTGQIYNFRFILIMIILSGSVMIFSGIMIGKVKHASKA